MFKFFYLFWIDTATMVFNKLTLEAMPDLVLKSLYHWFHEISCCWSQVFRSIKYNIKIFLWSVWPSKIGFNLQTAQTGWELTGILWQARMGSGETTSLRGSESSVAISSGVSSWSSLLESLQHGKVWWVKTKHRISWLVALLAPQKVRSQLKTGNEI